LWLEESHPTADSTSVFFKGKPHDRQESTTTTTTTTATAYAAATTPAKNGSARQPGLGELRRSQEQHRRVQSRHTPAAAPAEVGHAAARCNNASMNTVVQTTPEAEDSRLDAMWAKRHDTLFHAWVQVRYHRRRQRFFDLLDKGTKSITVVLGASLMGQYFREYLPWMATVITCLGLLALVFGYGDRKQMHKELAEQAAKLIADIETVTLAQLSFERTAGWAAEYARLVAKSPPPLKSLSLICEREQAAFEGNPEHVGRVPFLKRVVSDFM
jgi:hypothetical protein